MCGNALFFSTLSYRSHESRGIIFQVAKQKQNFFAIFECLQVFEV